MTTWRSKRDGVGEAKRATESAQRSSNPNQRHCPAPEAPAVGREIVGYQDGTHPGWRCHIHLARYLSEEPRCSFGIEVVESSSGLARASVLITSFRTSDGRESSISHGAGVWRLAYSFPLRRVSFEHKHEEADGGCDSPLLYSSRSGISALPLGSCGLQRAWGRKSRTSEEERSARELVDQTMSRPL